MRMKFGRTWLGMRRSAIPRRSATALLRMRASNHGRNALKSAHAPFPIPDGTATRGLVWAIINLTSPKRRSISEKRSGSGHKKRSGRKGRPKVSRMKLAVLSLVLFTLAVPSVAQEESCDGTTYDIANCMARILRKVDIELNAVYQKSLKVAKDPYTPADLQNLKDAERKWIAYRDAACKAERGLWGLGTGASAAHTGCLIRITKERIAALREAYLPEEPQK